MIYYTGDIHGDPYEVIQFCDSKKLTEQDNLLHVADGKRQYTLCHYPVCHGLYAEKLL